MTPTRRLALQQCAGLVALLAASAGAGASDAQELLFDATSMEDAIRALGGVPAAGTQITLSLPDAVEDGALVPVTVESQLPGVSEIYLLVESNPNPVAARFSFAAGTLPYVATRIKMAESCRVFAVVRSAAGLHAVSRSAQVTVGGCG
jgi:sulfur-oxidizing protein SoxY